MKEGIFIYQSSDGKNKMEMTLIENDVWLNQYQIQDLFQVDRTCISRHINAIYKTEELDINKTTKLIEKTKLEGKRSIKRNIIHYNFDMIISLGFRVNSKRGVKHHFCKRRLYFDI